MRHSYDAHVRHIYAGSIFIPLLEAEFGWVCSHTSLLCGALCKPANAQLEARCTTVVALDFLVAEESRTGEGREGFHVVG